MLEIIILYNLCKGIGKTAREKGRQAIGYQFLLVAFWFAGEFGGLIVGVGIAGEGGADNILVLIIPALVGAAAGACLAFTIVSSVPPLRVHDEPYPSLQEASGS